MRVLLKRQENAGLIALLFILLLVKWGG